MLAAVTFVPTTDVIRAFESLSENFPLDALAQAIIDYFEDAYILSTDSLKKCLEFGGRGYCIQNKMGGFCPGEFCLGGFCPRGILSGGILF